MSADMLITPLSERVSLLVLPLLAWAAWTDLIKRTIPNAVCIALLVIGFALRAAAGPWPLATSAGIAALAFVVLAAAHAAGALGGGDVKLAAAMLVGLSPLAAYRFTVMTILAGGVLVLVHLALRALPPARPAPAGAALPTRIWRAERWRVQRHGGLPYGIAIAFGGCWAVLTTLGG